MLSSARCRAQKSSKSAKSRQKWQNRRKTRIFGQNGQILEGSWRAGNHPFLRVPRRNFPCPAFFSGKKTDLGLGWVRENSWDFKSVGDFEGRFPQTGADSGQKAPFSLMGQSKKKMGVLFSAPVGKERAPSNGVFHQKARFFPRLPCYRARVKTPNHSI